MFTFTVDCSGDSGNYSCNSCNDFAKGFQFGVAAEYDFSDDLLKLSLPFEIAVPVMSSIPTFKYSQSSIKTEF